MATFRRRGERWQAIIRRVDLKASKSFDRLVDAKAWARAQERAADMAGTAPARMIGTLGPLVDRYAQEIWPVKRWGQNKAAELRILARDLGDRRLEDLGQGAVLKYVRGLSISPGGVATRLSFLREVLKTAGELWGTTVPLAELDRAIVSARRLGMAGKSGVRTRRPTAEEIEAIVAHAEKREAAQIDLAVIVRILSVLPLRVGELLGIGWPDIDATTRSAIIRNRKHPDVQVREGNDQVVPLIAFQGVDTYDLIAGRPAYLPSPFPYKRQSVSSAFGMAALRCGIKDLHLHDLRAYALSRLLEASIPIPLVALLSGHRNWKVLQRNYARLDPAAVHDALRRLA